ncbi:exonuclease SbcCD subunit D [Halobacillus sp. Marseille-Q1614]|uniref:exonuclease SbcCD subunit D n=1 Tax=Halobacillus sp. Marseille-Q1614 TaxID=2709134 RepID=UPI001570DC0E|nr:exonuclease SbcCD subunit D [Halobacillus sp. Marseille-Q1614]
MKILHTADWHLGKIVNNVYMTVDQEDILHKLMEIVRAYQPDAVIIAGDLYDRSIPPKEAVDLLNRTLTKLIQEFNIPVLAISGNHDSADRLEFGAQIFRSQGLYLDTKLSQPYHPVTLEDEHGPVHFHLIPYVEPAEVAHWLEDSAIKSHHQATERIIDYISTHYDMSERHLWVGHAFIAGGMESESEERLSMVGGSPYVDAGLFDEFSYVALGHLHQAQKIKREAVRYSGSILKYSFSEVHHKKSVTMVHLGEEGVNHLEKLPLYPKRDFEIVEGYFSELLEGDKAANPENYLYIRLLDDGQILDPMGKLRKVYPNILHLERARLSPDKNAGNREELKQRQKMEPVDLFTSFYKDIKGEELPEHRRELIQTAIESLRKEDRER